jgi:ABC-2 type transport system permease protein
MIFITVISREMPKIIDVANKDHKPALARLMDNMSRFFSNSGKHERHAYGNEPIHPFRAMIDKEITDHIRSWRFIILLIIIVLTCLGSVSIALANIEDAIKTNENDVSFLFLRLFTASDGTLPPFFILISFLGPLLGISMGFDAINLEENKGTLSRIMSHPVHRDYIINAKFVAAFIVLGVMFFSLGFLVMGLGLIYIGIPPSAGEFLRIVFFIMLSILYVAFWLNLSIFFSVKFRQPATSALAGIAVWLFFTVFYSIIVSLIAKATAPSETATSQQVLMYQEFILSLFRILPSQLFSDATTTILVPTVRSLGPLTVEKIYGTIPGALPLGQSLLLVWPQITGLIAGTILCFVLSYVSFLKREIRSR